MPRIHDMKVSRFLKQAECTPPIMLTIKSCQQVNVAREDAKPEMHWTLSFVETEKDLVLKPINMDLISTALGSDNTDHWMGKKIVLFTDPTISMGGKIVGGIRCRGVRVTGGQSARAQAPRGMAAAAPPVDNTPLGFPEEQGQETEVPGEDIPF